MAHIRAPLPPYSPTHTHLLTHPPTPDRHSQMKSKIKSLTDYKTHQAFLDDVHLLVENCRTYNGKLATITQFAEEMAQEAENYLADVCASQYLLPNRVVGVFRHAHCPALLRFLHLHHSIFMLMHTHTQRIHPAHPHAYILHTTHTNARTHSHTPHSTRMSSLPTRQS